MPKRRSDGGGSSRSAKRHQRQHLYLLFDDSEGASYSVRKVDLSSDTDSEGAVLPKPRAIFRMDVERAYSQYFAAAFGSKIIPMPVKRCIGKLPDADGSGSLSPVVCEAGEVAVYDVHTRGFTGFGPDPKVVLSEPICIPIGDRLFVLSTDSFQVLKPPSMDEPEDQCWKGSWRKLPLQPFHGDHITSYAVHPDGRTIFVSAKKWATSTFTTYSFDTAKSRSEWKKHGDWALPFTGRAHFDPNLEAWVGVSGDLNCIRNICACDVVSVKSDGGGGHRPSWKFSKEALFSEGPADFPANLVFMGNKFCLVECVCLFKDGTETPYDPPQIIGRPHLRLVTFSLEYDKDNGDLTTANSHRVRYCKVPKAAEYSLMEPMAFWL